MKEGDFFRSKDKGSQFWKSVHKIKYLFKWGAIHSIGNGKITRFWDDVWLTSSPLRIGFPRVYEICEERDISVADCAKKNWNLKFRRMMSQEVYEEWTNLSNLLEAVRISNSEDQVV
jgi:hypothetical protein